MAISEALLPEFDHETANTRKTLERIPEDKLTWKPHPKSPAMAWLGGHLANILRWAVFTTQQDSVDGAAFPKPPLPASRQQILDTFDSNRAAARAAIAATSDARWMEPWSLLNGEKTIFTLPRIAAVRGFIMSHSIHHRAQLTVYLRLNDVPVPALYGPSADEGSFG
ncbi:MAG: DinB family protein [Terriglobales bacterium]